MIVHELNAREYAKAMAFVRSEITKQAVPGHFQKRVYGNTLQREIGRAIWGHITNKVPDVSVSEAILKAVGFSVINKIENPATGATEWVIEKIISPAA